MTAKEISEKLEINIRTMYRYMDALSASGVPIVADAGHNGGYTLLNNFVEAPLFFHTEEQTALLHAPILAKEALIQGTVVAAICGATLGLAKKGLLDSQNHTSNDLEYLKMVVPNYSGEKYYKTDAAVRDENLVTASGTDPLEFTFRVLKLLDVFKGESLNSWLNLYKTNESRYFFELMDCNK